MTMEEVESYPMLVQAVAEYGLNEYDHFRYKRFTSFLEVDCSFLTPWKWNPNGFGTTGVGNPNVKSKREFMQFQPGSFVSYEHEADGDEDFTAADEEDLTKKTQISVRSGELEENYYFSSPPFLCIDRPSYLVVLNCGYMKPVQIKT